MSKVKLVTPEKARRVDADGAASEGGVTRFSYLSGRDDPLHLEHRDIAPNATDTIESDAAPAVVFVWKGSLETGGKVLAARSSALVERGGAMPIRAGADGASVLIFHEAEASDDKSARKVHLLPAENVPTNSDIFNDGLMGAELHADASLPTCKVWLHESEFYQEGYEVGLHSHSEDEVIFIREGQIKLGNRLYGPGTALAIAADTKYAFQVGPGGLSFANFRATSPTYTTADGSQVLDEAEAFRELTGSPVYLELAS